jgi:hypothetical protein
MLPSDIYSQPHAADPVLDERTVLDIVRRHGVRCSAITRIDETGGAMPISVIPPSIGVGRPTRIVLPFCMDAPAGPGRTTSKIRRVWVVNGTAWAKNPLT